MARLPVIKGNEFIKFLESLGFRVTRMRGSHVRMRAEDGRVTTVSVQKSQNLLIGLFQFDTSDGVNL